MYATTLVCMHQIISVRILAKLFAKLARNGIWGKLGCCVLLGLWSFIRDINNFDINLIFLSLR